MVQVPRVGARRNSGIVSYVRSPPAPYTDLVARVSTIQEQLRESTGEIASQYILKIGVSVRSYLSTPLFPFGAALPRPPFHAYFDAKPISTIPPYTSSRCIGIRSRAAPVSIGFFARQTGVPHSLPLAARTAKKSVVYYRIINPIMAHRLRADGTGEHTLDGGGLDQSPLSPTRRSSVVVRIVVRRVFTCHLAHDELSGTVQCLHAVPVPLRQRGSNGGALKK